MKNFREAYKKAADSIRVPDITAEAVMDALHSKKIAVYRCRRRFTAVASAACIFLLCTAGVAAAAGYARSIITVDEHGFKTADVRTAMEGGVEAACIEETGAEEVYDAPLMISGVEEGTAESEAAVAELRADAEARKEAAENAPTGDAWVEEVKQAEYMSLEAFEAAEELAVALPKEAGSGNTLSENYLVCGDMLLVRIETEKGLIMMNQVYYGGSDGHASSTVYPGEICNERIYTTGQGFTYTVIDSVDAGSKTTDIHAAVSIGDYELIVNFSGYTEEEAFATLEGMDLTVYLSE